MTIVGIIANAVVWFACGCMVGHLWTERGYKVVRKDKCECHERDSSYTCDKCKKEGFYGHMEQK